MNSRKTEPQLLTPSKRLNNNLSSLKHHTKNAFQSLFLNKAEPRKRNAYWAEEPYTKGVATEQLLLFIPRLPERDRNTSWRKRQREPLPMKFSFAVEFSGIYSADETETAVISIMPCVQAGTAPCDREHRKMRQEMNKMARRSAPMTIDEFRTKLNQLNKQLAEEKLELPELSYQTTIDLLGKVFDIDIDALQASWNNGLALAQEAFSKKISQKLQLEVAAKAELKNAHAALDKAQKLVDAQIQQTPEYRELQELLKRTEVLNESIKAQTAALAKTHEIKSLLKTFEEKERACDSLAADTDIQAARLRDDRKLIPPQFSKVVALK